MDISLGFPQTGGQPVSDRMRELLARAARGDADEQRPQGEVLDEIRRRLDAVRGVDATRRSGRPAAALEETMPPLAEAPPRPRREGRR